MVVPPPHWRCSVLVAQCNHGKMRLRRMGRCRCMWRTYTQIAKWLSEFALQTVAGREGGVREGGKQGLVFTLNVAN